MVARTIGLAVLSVLGCGGTRDVTPLVSKTIGSAGGVVTAPDGTAIDIPAGALASDTLITISAGPDAILPSPWTRVGATYDFGPDGLVFAAPASITLAVSVGMLPAGTTIDDVVVVTPVSGGYDPLIGTTTVDATHVRAATSHFTCYGAAAAPGRNQPCAPSGACATGLTCATVYNQTGVKCERCLAPGEFCTCTLNSTWCQHFTVGSELVTCNVPVVGQVGTPTETACLKGCNPGPPARCNTQCGACCSTDMSTGKCTCTCEPNTVSCIGNALTTCNNDGCTMSSVDCQLGCDVGPPAHCN